MRKQRSGVGVQFPWVRNETCAMRRIWQPASAGSLTGKIMFIIVTGIAALDMGSPDQQSGNSAPYGRITKRIAGEHLHLSGGICA